MCGRTACALAPDDICRACGHKTKDGRWRQPRWRDPPGGQKYYTSYNVGPTSHTPILLSAAHFPSPTEQENPSPSPENSNDPPVTPGNPPVTPADPCEWVIQPMHWGLVPSWTQGDSKSSSYSMNNARSESMLTKRSFKGPLERGRRCVVLADGYYEWQTDRDGKKQPYFLYSPHATAETVDQLNTETENCHNRGKKPYFLYSPHATAETVDQLNAETYHCHNRVYNGRRLLMMAGLFDVWTPPNGEAPLYSYSVITVDSHKEISWLHERMPAVLQSEAEVCTWLDYRTVPLKSAVSLIKPRPGLHHHPVSSTVGNVRNKGEECVKLVDLEKEKSAKAGASSSVMMSWLNKGKKRSADAVSQSQSPSQPAGQSENLTQSANQSGATQESPKKQKTEDQSEN